MIIFGIDPGPTMSGGVWFNTTNRRVLSSNGAMPNAQLIGLLRTDITCDAVACECIEAMYAHVGKETVRTIRFTGNIEESCYNRRPITLLSPQEVKKRVCGTASAKDPAVRQALIDQLGPPGTKKAQGPTYGVSKHAWRALAVALAAIESESEATQ